MKTIPPPENQINKRDIVPDKNFPKYVLIPVAILHSELYWVCSVLYYMFRESGLVANQKTLPSRNRVKVKSLIPLKPHLDVLVEDKQQEEQEEQEEKDQEHTDHGIRARPTIHDELLGKTCPPLWWQKTRVKLGRPAVRGDHKPGSKSESSTTSSSSSSSTSSSPNEQKSRNRSNTVKSDQSLTSTADSIIPLSSNSSVSSLSLDSISPTDSIHSLQSEHFEAFDPQSSYIPKRHRKHRLLHKLNAALQNIHHHKK